MISFYLGLVFLLSFLNISCFADECDNNACLEEAELIFSKIVSFIVIVTLGTLIICCPCITYKYCCARVNPSNSIVYSSRTGVGVAVNLNPPHPPYPSQQFQHQQPIVYPLYGIPPPEYTPTAPPNTRQFQPQPH